MEETLPLVTRGTTLALGIRDRLELIEEALKQKPVAHFAAQFPQALFPAAEELCSKLPHCSPTSTVCCTVPHKTGALHLFHRVPSLVQKGPAASIAVVQDSCQPAHAVFLGQSKNDREPTFELIGFSVPTEQRYCVGNLGCLLTKIPEKITKIVLPWQDLHTGHLDKDRTGDSMKRELLQKMRPIKGITTIWQNMVMPFFRYRPEIPVPKRTGWKQSDLNGNAPKAGRT